MSTIRPGGKAQPEFCVAVRKKKLGSALLTTPALLRGSSVRWHTQAPPDAARMSGVAQGGRVVAAAGLCRADAEDGTEV
jgi:hypothetical protein